MMDGYTLTDLEMARESRRRTDHGPDKQQGDGHGQRKGERKENLKRVYKKEATITVDLRDEKEVRALDIIKAVTGKIGEGKILAVRPKQINEYEITLEQEEDTEILMNGLDINGMSFEVKRLYNRDYVVSFMHLPAYIEDEDILSKLEQWGVIPLSTIKRRVYPGTNVEDGTRFIKVRFPREVASLPYSTKMETAEGPQYFRVMHSHQVKTCRLCMSPDHVVKDCPDFRCYKCEERGHFARDCNAVKCPDCRKVLSKCECWMEGEEEEEEQVSGQVHERDTEKEQEEEIGGMVVSQTTENKGSKERMDEGNKQREQTQQEEENWTQMDMTVSLESVLDRAEPKDKEQNMEVGKEAEKGEEDNSAKPSKRRRSIKVIPNMEVAKKRVTKKSVQQNMDRNEVVKDLEEMG